MDTRNRTPTITGDAFLPEVLGQYPGTRAVFDRYGLHGCGGTWWIPLLLILGFWRHVYRKFLCDTTRNIGAWSFPLGCTPFARSNYRRRSTFHRCLLSLVTLSTWHLQVGS